MSSPFPFIPRKVAKNHRVAQNRDKAQAHDNARELPVKDTLPSAPVTGPQKDSTNAKGKATLKEHIGGPSGSGDSSPCSDEEYAIAISLALSDYALWSDPDLRQKRDVKQKEDESVENEFFIPLSYLLQHSPLLAQAGIGYSESTELAVARALRAVTSDVFDVRMIVSGTTPHAWASKNKTGLYEIRRKDWANSDLQLLPNYSRSEWEKRTIYVENIPPRYRTIPLIARFILSLRIQPSFDASTMSKIQAVTLLPSHLDKHGAQPRCKGFALVILSDPTDVDALLAEWPWKKIDVQGEDSSDQEARQEALKYGFKTLPKQRWEELQEEYLAYRQKLLATDSPASHVAEHSQTSGRKRSVSPLRNEPTPPFAPVIPDAISPSYPTGCLVFVRNVQPETNKTTLRALFVAAFQESPASVESRSDGIDYVDFTKGMDSCHIRLKTPRHAQILVNHFSSNPTLQSRGLDDAGISLSKSSSDLVKAIKMEVVQGIREEVYWEKVPPKVRQQALTQSNQPLPGDVHDASQMAAEKRTRKRRKH